MIIKMIFSILAIALSPLILLPYGFAALFRFPDKKSVLNTSTFTLNYLEA